jgi:hypothetical protein
VPVSRALLADLLDAAGARAVLTRGIADEVTDLDRVRVASREHADWYIRIDAALADTGSATALLHYPNSAGGERLARALAPWLERRLGRPARPRTDTQFVLQQTPCPAVVVVLPLARGEASSFVDPDGLRQRAYALFVGLRAALDAEGASRPPLVGKLQPGEPARAALAMLDGAEVLPLATDGSFRFECVAPGRRLLRLQSEGSCTEIEISVSGTDTTRVQLPAPAGQP